MYLEQEAAFLLENKKMHGKQKQSKKNWKNSENPIINEKHKLV